MNEKDTALKILELVGGEENVVSVVHCITRLRFKLNDESKADDKAIEELELVQGLIKKAGQYQVVIGPSVVNRLYDHILENSNISNIDLQKETKKEKPLDILIDIISSIFTPVLGVMVASGMLKGFLSLFVTIGLLDVASQTYVLLNGIGDTFFYFMPVVLGYSSMKKFGGNPVLGMVIGAALVYPSIVDLGSAESIKDFAGGLISVKATILGIPIIIPMSGYTSSVLPIVFINFFAAKIEKLLDRLFPDVIKFLFVPLFTLVISVVLGLAIIGPIISILSTGLTALFLALSSAVPIIYGFVLAFLNQFMVIFGLHWAIAPIAFLEMSELQAGNIDKMTLMISTTYVCIAQMGTLLALVIKHRDHKLNNVAVPAMVTSFFGITEPGLYGVIIQRKKELLLTAVAAGFSGLFLALMNVGNYTAGGIGIFAIVSTLNPNDPGISSDFIYSIIAILIAFISAFILVFFFGEKKKVLTPNTDIITPIKGNVISAKMIKDEVFSTSAIGKTYGIIPESNEVVAPITGTVATVFPSKHAVGIIGMNGEEVLIHVGIDTVDLNGDGFTQFVKVGEEVSQGQKLLNVDFDSLEKKGYDTTVIVIITNEGNNAINYEVSQNKLATILNG